MTKCDFCTASTPSGKCSWELQSNRGDDCKKAIKRMTEAIKSLDKETKIRLFCK